MQMKEMPQQFLSFSCNLQRSKQRRILSSTVHEVGV
ncbi:hypothetical protein OIU78_022457 [Salix suchowensis]|nr:hypothetical protein OIU78_022457 [Salix suchowensis]